MPERIFLAAAKYIERLLKSIRQLLIQPKLGKKLKEEPFARDYIVRYAIRGETIYILKIWHGKEDQLDS